MVLHFLSWNVAGCIRLCARGQRLRPIGAYFERHGADVVCIQEAKGPRASNGEGLKLSARLKGWESFWDVARCKSLGFNGVTMRREVGFISRRSPARRTPTRQAWAMRKDRNGKVCGF